MFEFKGKAEVRDVKLRKEFLGDDEVKAVTISLRLTAVPVHVIEDGLISQLSLFFDKATNPIMTTVKPLEAISGMDRVRVLLGKVLMAEANISKVMADPKSGMVADLDMTIKSQVGKGDSSHLHDYLNGEASVEMKERQLDIVDAAA